MSLLSGLAMRTSASGKKGHRAGGDLPSDPSLEHLKNPAGLLGLYEGIPLTSRTSDYASMTTGSPNSAGKTPRGR
jgi:hypothetical protein